MKNDKIILEFVNYLSYERNFSKNTIRSYKNDLVQFDLFLKKYDKSLNFLKIDKTAIQFYIQHCSKNGVSDKTLLRKVATIKSLFRYLTENDLVDFNISSLISSPKIAKKIPHYLSKTQIKELMSLPDLDTKTGYKKKILICKCIYAIQARIRYQSQKIWSNFARVTHIYKRIT